MGMTKKQKERIIKKVTEIFPPANPKYPIIFDREHDGTLIITGESYARYPCENEEIEKEFGPTELPVIDYYGEYRDGYPWVHEKLEKLLEDNGYRYEWENPACIILYKE